MAIFPFRFIKYFFRLQDDAPARSTRSGYHKQLATRQLRRAFSALFFFYDLRLRDDEPAATHLSSLQRCRCEGFWCGLPRLASPGAASSPSPISIAASFFVLLLAGIGGGAPEVGALASAAQCSGAAARTRNDLQLARRLAIVARARRRGGDALGVRARRRGGGARSWRARATAQRLALAARARRRGGVIFFVKPTGAKGRLAFRADDATVMTHLPSLATLPQRAPGDAPPPPLPTIPLRFR